MTRSKIQMIKFFIFLLIFLLGQSAVCNGSFRIHRTVPESTSVDKSVDETAKKVSAYVSLDGQKTQQQNTILTGGITILEGNKTVDNVTSKQIDVNKTAHNTEIRKEHVGEGHATSLNAGALKRGFFVFVGLSVFVMGYFVFRSFSLNKTRTQMVRKYGVLAHRQDVEMRPLPLDEEDDEDTTVFDASNVLTNNVQHQNL
ncbi:hypothetical protein WH47_02678 [Habropoda laboriosa]|uniref:Uncharacterized protein n=1 Tax=Habropoda laboriosa TaxID=597456 RepID=A0A0L7QXA3_9HYME|nr:PREDICTED: uncharacterized protein LOC108574267 [Habropoda laboriosa]KOC63169.1 hypothetical protein WH47_02678 [Habropoda laboriosa]